MTDTVFNVEQERVIGTSCPHCDLPLQFATPAEPDQYEESRCAGCGLVMRKFKQADPLDSAG